MNFNLSPTKFFVLFALLLSLAGITRYSIAEEVNIEELVRKVDGLYRSRTSFAEIEMEIVTPHWQRILKMKVWTEGMNKTFIRILVPKKERGMATLRIGNEMWNYLPKTNKIIKIPPSMMMSSWMGSDFTNDDLVKEYTMTEDYKFQITTVENPREGLVYVKLAPRVGRPIMWGKVVMAVTEKDYIPVWEKFYDEKNNVMRVLNFSEIRDFNGRKIPSVMEMIPQKKEGHKTVIKYKQLEFDKNPDNEIFSMRNLRANVRD